MKYFSIVLIALGLVLASCTPTEKQEHKPNTVLLTDVFNLINDARAVARTCGKKSFPAVPKLNYNNQLAKAAQNHSIDMNKTGVLSHLSPAGSSHYTAGTTALKRIQAEGYQAIVIRENIAHGQTSAQDVVAAWLASPSHCESLMNISITQTGLGHDGTYWTQDFGQPQ